MHVYISSNAKFQFAAMHRTLPLLISIRRMTMSKRCRLFSLFDCRFEWRIFHRFAWIVIKPYYRRPATRHSLHSSAHRRQRANARCPRSKIAPGLRPTGNQGLLPLDLKMELIKTIKDLLQIPRLDLAIISLKIASIYLNIVFAITLSDNLGSNRLRYFQG